MVEKELQFIVDFTLNKIKKLGPFFTYRKLLNADIHPAILKYVSAEIDFKIYEDRKKLLQQSAFDYSGFEIAKYFDLISQQIKKKTKITYDDIKDLIVEAVTFNARYTIRPNTTLKKFIFSDKNKLSVDEIKMKLDSLYYYSYFSEILNAYFNKAKLLSINLKDFETILNKLDQSTFVDKKQELVEYAINSIADYYNVGSTDKSKIPVNLVESFLKDKALNDYLERLLNGFSNQSKQKQEINEITKVLFSVEPINIFASKPAAPKVEDEIIEFEEEIIPQKTLDEKEIETGKENKKEIKKKTEKETELKTSEQENLDPLYNFEEDKEFIEDETKELIDKEIEESEEFEVNAEDAPIAQEKIKEEESGKSINFSDEMINEEIELLEEFEPTQKEKKSKIFEPSDEINETEQDAEQNQEAAEKPESVKDRKKDVFYYLSNREIEKIVASIFNDDREDFATTMEKISECEDYDEATEILKQTFNSYNINPYSRDAVTLTNCVSNYFEQN